MRSYRRMGVLAVLVLSLIGLRAHMLLAIDEGEPPIIAIGTEGISFVSSEDGSARLIVARDREKDAQLARINAPSGFWFGPVSPDNTKFAYVHPIYEMLDPAFEGKLDTIARSNPMDITVVDIASGALIPITEQGSNFLDVVQHDNITQFPQLTWSPDAQRLYFIAERRSMYNRLPRTTIEYYDVATSERRTFLVLRPHQNLLGLYAMSQGIVIVDGYQNQGDMTFTFYAPDGRIINMIKKSFGEAMGCTNGLMLGMNPVFNEDYFYGYYESAQVDDAALAVPFLLSVDGDFSIPLEGNIFPGIMSHGHAETSWRILFTDPCYLEEGDRWTLTDAEGNFIISLPLTGFGDSEYVALSPDGESIAITKASTIQIMDETDTREIDFTAYFILWGATDFTFAPLIHRG